MARTLELLRPSKDLALVSRGLALLRESRTMRARLSRTRRMMTLSLNWVVRKRVALRKRRIKETTTTTLKARETMKVT